VFQVKDELFRSNYIKILRVKDVKNNIDGVLKVFEISYFKENTIEINSIFKFVKDFDYIEGVIDYYNLIDFEGEKAIFMEDIGGVDLKRELKKYNFSIRDVIDISIKILDVLEKIHEHGYLHGNLTLDNIIFNKEKNIVKLIGINQYSKIKSRKINSFIDKKNKNFCYYSSPEQCGFIDRNIDYRSDFYSLGLIIYELLNEEFAFEFYSCKDMIYKQTFAKIENLKAKNIKIPKILSDIVGMLLNKKPENRYQSCSGIKYDLIELIDFMDNAGANEYFIPGQNDYSIKRFKDNEILFGRTNEKEFLTDKFNLLLSNKKELIFIKGNGKVSLINDFKEYVFKSRGIFAKTTADKFTNKTPFYSLDYLFEQIVNLILMETDQVREKIKNELIKSVEGDTDILFNLLPCSKEFFVDMEMKDREFKNLDNKLYYYIHKILKVFDCKTRPIIIFFDDVQYIDKSSLELLTKVFLDKSVKYISCIIGHSNINNKESSNILKIKENCNKSNIIYSELKLNNLSKNDVKSILYDNLRTIEDNEDINYIVNLIFDWTKGNPKYIKEILEYFKYERCIYFDGNILKYDLKKINLIGELNIEDIIKLKLDKLSRNTREFLIFVSCFGNRVMKEHLLEIYNITSEEFYKILVELINFSFIDNYKEFFEFRHALDKNYIYNRIHDRDKKMYHYKIGKLFLKNLNKNKKYIFNTLEHFTISHSLLNNAELENLPELYYTAGIAAKKMYGYSLAYEFLKKSEEIINKDKWNKDYKFIFNLYIVLIETSYLVGDFETLIEKGKKVLSSSKNALDNSKVYLYLLKATIFDNKFDLTIKYCIDGLKDLGVKIPKNISKLEIIYKYYKIRRLINDKTKKMSLVQMVMNKDKDDIYKERAIKLIDESSTSIFFISTKLYIYLILTKIEYVVKYSNSIDNINAINSYSIILCNLLKKIDEGYELSKGIHNFLIKNKENEIDIRSELLFNIFIRHWKEPILNCMEPLKQVFLASIKKDNIDYGSNAVLYFAVMSVFLNYNLSEYLKEVDNNILILKKTNQKFTVKFCLFMKQIAVNLIYSESPWYIKGEFADEKELLDNMEEKKVNLGKSLIYSFKVIMSYLFDDFNNIDSYMDLQDANETYFAGTYLINLVDFYKTLILQEKIKNTSSLKFKKYMLKINRNVQKIKLWSFYAPKNYLHKYYLVEAQRLYLNKDKRKAENYFKRAVDTSSKAYFYNEEALCNEKMAEFNYKEGFHDIARIYYNRAIICYEKWGALQKVKHLLNKIKEFTEIKYTFNKLFKNNEILNVDNQKINNYVMFSQKISQNIEYENLIKEVIFFVERELESEYSVFLVKNWDAINLNASKKLKDKDIEINLEGSSINENILPISIVKFCINFKEFIILSNAFEEGLFSDDQYIHTNRVKSVLCIPIIRNREVCNIIYLENNSIEGAFSLDKLEIINVVLEQISISLDNVSVISYIKDFNDSLQKGNDKLSNDVNNIYRDTQKIFYNIKKITNTDKTTGLLNRRLFVEKVKSEYIRYKMTKRKFTIVLILIENLDKYIKKYKYDFSDKILNYISNLIKDNIRCTDNVAKWEEKKFILLLTETSILEAENLIYRMNQLIKDFNFYYMNEKINITLKYGMAEIDKDISIEECINLSKNSLEKSEKFKIDLK
jgi:diguanylate cyclase (GGDEF)-like protein